MEKNTEERSQEAEDLLGIKACKRVKNATSLIEVCRQVKDGHSAKRYRGTLIDSVTANMFCTVYDAIKLPDAKAKLEEIADKNHVHAINICWKLVK